MSFVKSVCAAALLSVALPALASAATSLGTITFDYGEPFDLAGNPTGKDQPSGWSGALPSQRDPLNADNVKMRDTSTASGYHQFVQIFDLTKPEFLDATITEFRLTIHYAQVDSAPVVNKVDDPNGIDRGERWYARILGDDNSTLNDDFFKTVPGIGGGTLTDTGTFTITLNASNDGSDFGSDRTDSVLTANTAFQSSIDEGRLRLRFREESGGADIMWVDMASLEVIGTENVFGGLGAIPVPASGLLLIGAVGGLVALRRRKTSE